MIGECCTASCPWCKIRITSKRSAWSGPIQDRYGGQCNVANDLAEFFCHDGKRHALLPIRNNRHIKVIDRLSLPGYSACRQVNIWVSYLDQLAQHCADECLY